MRVTLRKKKLEGNKVRVLKRQFCRGGRTSRAVARVKRVLEVVLNSRLSILPIWPWGRSAFIKGLP